jgi:signal transduction histidine kinase/ActR/RegA family two-component response regulator
LANSVKTWCARSGNEALARLMEMEFAVILLDVNMPDMDGFETASLIHQHPRHEKTPIIFVTAVHITDLDRLRGYDVGAVDYVFVPVVPQILRSKVTVLCELYRQRRELERLNSRLATANADLAEVNAALQAEKALELHKLNDALETSNRSLASSNASLQAEVSERQRAEHRLREADRRKDEFLATLAHELRNPLAPIRNALQLVTSGDSRAASEAMRIIQRQLRQMVRLIDDLLDVSRITRGKLEMRKQRVALDAVIEDAIDTVRPSLDEAGQRLSLHMPQPAPVLEADRERLAQVFSNLLGNACKYSTEGAEIRLTAELRGTQVVVTVVDEGIGLKPDQLESVFELFVQADTSLERERGGLGIGLTIVRQLVEMHGGRVAAASGGLGRGSTFTVELPLEATPPLADVAAPIEAPAARPQASARRRILIVDDNRDAADTLAMTLDLLGHEVRTYYDPLQALEHAAGYSPDLVFMDVGMPGMNGYDLARRWREQEWSKDAFLVALTGWGQEEARRSSRDAGIDQHLVKPADFADIERMCRMHRSDVQEHPA